MPITDSGDPFDFDPMEDIKGVIESTPCPVHGQRVKATVKGKSIEFKPCCDSHEHAINSAIGS